jgi:hypothetical protein
MQNSRRCLVTKKSRVRTFSHFAIPPHQAVQLREFQKTDFIHHACGEYATKIDSGNRVGRIRLLFASMSLEIRAWGKGLRDRARPSANRQFLTDSTREITGICSLALRNCSLYVLLAGLGQMNHVLSVAATATALVLAMVFSWLSVGSRKKTGIPPGEVFYPDLIGRPFHADTLRSPKLGISGKPDCLIRTVDGVVPVEFEEIQAAASSRQGLPEPYNPEPCLLCPGRRSIEATSAVRFGHLRPPAGAASRIYRGKQAVAMTTILDVRAARGVDNIVRNHNQRGRCSGCGV